jgi:L-threonylcarbamoyladenylate synthase
MVLIVNTKDTQLKKAAKLVKKGGLIIYPTDTVYGLGCDPYNLQAVKKVFEVKGRKNKPLPVLISSMKKALDLAYFTSEALKIVKKYWPGPLTIVLKRRENAPSFLGGDPSLIGLRIPKHPVALKLIRLCGGSLIGTSANLTGKKPPTTVDEAIKQIGDKVDLIIDGGETAIGLGSTVLDLSTETPKILREGPITKEEISSLLKKKVC